MSMIKTCKNCVKNNTLLCKFRTEGDFTLEACFDWTGIPYLETMFEKQIMLQRQLGVYPTLYDEQYIKDMTLAAMVELTEILNETPWKPWKKQQSLNPDKYLEEVADLMHFIINLCLVANITPDMLYEAYSNKNKVNQDRNKGRY